MPPGLDDPSLRGLLINIGIIVGIVIVTCGLALLVRFLAPIVPIAYPSKESYETHERLKDQE